MPSHVGVRGNEIVDKLAKSGAAHEEVEIQIPAEVGDEHSLIDAYIMKQWQTQYNSSIGGAAYRLIESDVSTKTKFADKCRKKDTLISLLRLGKCLLNKYLQEMHRHPDGLCQLCQEAETIEHLLLRCKLYDVAERLQNECATLALPPSLTTILSSPKLVDLVFDLVRGLKRTL